MNKCSQSGRLRSSFFVLRRITKKSFSNTIFNDEDCTWRTSIAVQMGLDWIKTEVPLRLTPSGRKAARCAFTSWMVRRKNWRCGSESRSAPILMVTGSAAEVEVVVTAVSLNSGQKDSSSSHGGRSRDIRIGPGCLIFCGSFHVSGIEPADELFQIIKWRCNLN